MTGDASEAAVAPGPAIGVGNEDRAGLDAVESTIAAGRSDEAERALLDALQKNPRDAPRLMMLGRLFVRANRLGEAATIYERAIEVARGRICLFGHTHVPAIYTTVGDPVEHSEELEEDELHLPKTGPALLNVGSVGQPRDGDPRAAYGLLDLEKNTLRLRRVNYDIKGAQTDILKAGLPAWLAQRLDKGQ